MKFNETNIKALAELMKENNIESLDLEQEGERLVLKSTRKEKKGIIFSQETPAPTMSAMPSTPVASVRKDSPAVTVQAPTNCHKITSPMVGTFYSSSSPDSPVYVVEGQQVNIGDTLCIVEAMKLMNEIKSTVSGKVLKICVQNADAIKTGEELFWIE